MKKYYYVILTLVFTSCYTLPQKTKFYQSFSTLELGVLGEQKKSLRKSSFQVAGIPVYRSAIRLDFAARDFDSQDFKSYQAFLKNSTKRNLIEYYDSLEVKPKYFELKVNDKVTILNEITSKGYNSSLNEYIYNNPDLSLITQIKFVASKNTLKLLSKAEALFLRTIEPNQSYIMIYQGGKLINKINSSELQVFQYEVSSFCWRIPESGNSRIVSLTEEGELCKNGTVRNPIKEIEKRKKARIELDY